MKSPGSHSPTTSQDHWPDHYRDRNVLVIGGTGFMGFNLVRRLVDLGAKVSAASRGFTVLEAGNGIEAIEVLEKSDRPVDIVVSDVVMPEMDGPTLARELRIRNPNLKIIFVSGYAQDAFQKHLPESGKYGFLPKPFTLKQLVAAVKETLSG